MRLVTEKVKPEIMRHYKAHVRFWLLRTGNTEEEQTPNNALATTAIAYRHTGALNSCVKMKI